MFHHLEIPFQFFNVHLKLLFWHTDALAAQDSFFLEASSFSLYKIKLTSPVSVALIKQIKLPSVVQAV